MLDAYKDGGLSIKKGESVSSAVHSFRTLFQRHIDAYFPYSSNLRASTMSISVSVQPPSKVQAGTVLYPPLVVSSETSVAYDFLQVALLDPRGRVVESALWGTVSMSKQELNDDHASGSSSKEYAAFPDLAITSPGNYSLQVTAYRMDYESPDGPSAIIVSSKTTRKIEAREGAVGSGTPCKYSLLSFRGCI